MKTISEPTSAVDQKETYNRNLGGNLNVKADPYSLPTGTAWAVVGTVVADEATADDVPTLEAAIEALDEVDAAEPLVWGQQPDVEADAHDAVLHCEARLSQVISTGDLQFSNNAAYHRPQILPDGKKWVVWLVKVPAMLTQASVATLQAAITGITGITLTRVLCHDAVSAEVTGMATLKVSCHVRIEPEQVAE